MSTITQKTQKTLVSIGVFGLPLIAATGFLFLNLSTFDADLSAQLLQKRDLENTVSGSLAIKNSIQNTGVERATLASFFISTKGETAALIEQVEQLAEDNDVLLTLNVSARAGSLGGEESVLRLEIQAEGGFENVYRFVKLIELLPYKVFVSGLDMRTKGRDGSAGWSVVMIVEIISFQEE